MAKIYKKVYVEETVPKEDLIQYIKQVDYFKQDGLIPEEIIVYKESDRGHGYIERWYSISPRDKYGFLLVDVTNKEKLMKFAIDNMPEDLVYCEY